MKDRSFVVVAICFFLSGLAALIYETAWTREFSFVFGTSELAVATVLAAYMAGLAGGAAVGGRIAHRTERALALYGFLELGVGVAALLVPVALAGATQLLVALFGGQSEFAETNPLAISTFYLVSTFLIVMVPTGFMGATLPLLSRHAVQRDDEIGSKIGGLYAINTIGAVAGTLTAAFVLLPNLGIRQTVHVAVAVNGLVFLVAMVLVRIAKIEASDAPSPPAGESSISGRFHFILPLILVSGALSFTYEVMWVRLLSQTLGGSVYAFATMLGSFLLGIALGSAVASRLASSTDRSVRLFAAAQIGIAVLSAIAFWAIDSVPAAAEQIENQKSLLFDVSIAGLILLPSALCIGATFPFAVRIVAMGASDAGPASARVYTWNTVGAIIGSIGAAFVLLPELGFRGTITMGLGLNVLLAALTLYFGERDRKRMWIPIVVGTLLIAALPGEPWQTLRSSPMNRSPKQGEIKFFEVGRGATVMLTEESLTRWRISTNGLPESMISSAAEPPGRTQTAVMLGQIGPMLRPEARTMLVVGLGGGVTVERVPHNIERIDVIELEEEVLAANRWLSPARAIDPLADPRIHVHINDARSALFLSEQKFDVIAAQASHPWTGGAAHLYTDEFFELAASRLTDRGVFVQWVGRAFVDVDLIKSLVATLRDHFEYVHVYKEILFVSSNSPLPDEFDLEALLVHDPDFSRRSGFYRPEDFAPYLLMDAFESAEFAKGAPRTSDDRNLLQMRSPLLRRKSDEISRRNNRIVNKAYAKHDPLPRQLAEGTLDPFLVIQKVRAFPQPERARTLTQSITDPTIQERLRVLKARGASGRAGLEKFLEQHPDDKSVRASVLRLNLARLAPGRSLPPDLVRGGYDDHEQAYVDASIRSQEFGWSAVEPLDDALAAIDPTHPLFLDTVVFRVKWRIESGDAALAREAISILDDAYTASRFNRLLVLRSSAATVAGDVPAALASLSRIPTNTGKNSDMRLRDEGRSLLKAMELEGAYAEWRDELLRNHFRKTP